MNYPWGDQRRFNSYANYFRQRFGNRVQKVTIDAGFTCPNRDGTIGTGGCDFCNNEGFNPSYCSPEKSISQQIAEGIEFHQWRYKKAISYLAYFQAYTNTYAPTGILIQKYEEALACDGIAGLVIGTRPDCIADELLTYLRERSKTHHIHLEIGIESVYDKTLEGIHRGHNFESARDALNRAKQHGLTTGGHFIFGLPGETEQMMLDSAEIISSLPLDTVKFHQLQILKNTRFEERFLENPAQFHLFGFEEYIHFIIRLLERLNPSIVVERFAGEVPPRYQVTSGFGLIRNEQILARIEQELESLNTWQGRLYRSSVIL
jgi:uncharacterized protein